MAEMDAFDSINTVRTLSADIVQKATCGHPGAPMGCAPMAHVLFSRFCVADPTHPAWPNRDRFVLSNGHGCVLQYVMWHLLGFNVHMDDLKAFRQFGAKTPGHPEANHGIDGIEVTTGPLGQGIANAVGLALAGCHMQATFNKPGFNIFSNTTYCILGDGCLQEGVQAEAVALAGHLKLGNLVCLYDDNHISIDGDTNLGFTEDVCKRFEAYGWHTQVVADGDNDLAGIAAAIEQAKQVTDKPSLIKIRTTIGFGSTHQGEEKVHGSALGAADIAQLKQKFGFNPDEFFKVPQKVYEFWKAVSAKNAAVCDAWQLMFAKYRKEHPELANELDRRLKGTLPDIRALVPKYSPKDPAAGSRKWSEQVLNKLAPALPELVGGSADLTGSNLTRWKSAVDFQHPSTGLGSYAGRYIRFGVREHGMAAVCNGMAAYGGIIPFGATFFNFISYALGAVRLSALSKHPVIYIMTHDSIGLGEDGPTHQPIETLAGIRAMPNIIDFRPADGNEVSASYIAALENNKRPSVLIFSRQNLPNLAGSSIEKALCGAYIVQPAKDARLILVATGSEVSLACESADALEKTHGVPATVVSMPSWRLFDEQPLSYKQTVFPQGIPVVSVEAMSTLGWQKYAHYAIGVDAFGKSAPYLETYKYFGLVPSVIAEKAWKISNHYSKNTPEWKMQSDPCL